MAKSPATPDHARHRRGVAGISLQLRADALASSLANASGKALVETYSITGMGHGTPVDPGTGERQCGN